MAFRSPSAIVGLTADLQEQRRRATVLLQQVHRALMEENVEREKRARSRLQESYGDVLQEVDECLDRGDYRSARNVLDRNDLNLSPVLKQLHRVMVCRRTHRVLDAFANGRYRTAHEMYDLGKTLRNDLGFRSMVEIRRTLNGPIAEELLRRADAGKIHDAYDDLQVLIWGPSLRKISAPPSTHRFLLM